MVARRLASACAAAFVVQLGMAGGASATTFNANPGSLGPIPDGTGPIPSFGAPLNVTIPVSGLPTGDNPMNVAVTLTGEHDWTGDLLVELVAPGGSPTATIFGRTGAPTAGANGSAADLGGTYTFTDQAVAAPTWWTAAASAGPAEAIPDGVYRPSASGGAGGTGANTTITPTFGTVLDPNGNWTLRVRDGASGDTGEITGASLELNTRVNADAGTLGAIPDGTLGPGYGPPRDVTFQITGLPFAPLSDVSVRMTLVHPFVGDVDAVLIGPDGTTQTTVFSRTGAASGTDPGDASDLNGEYRFFDANLGDWWAAATTAGAGTAIPPGNYRATTPGGAPGGGATASLTTPFAGLGNPNGTWTLRLRDHQIVDTGSISAANLRLLPSLDSSAPAKPAIDASDPASPSSSNNPSFQGTAESGSTVRLYANGACTGLPAATGSAAQFDGPGISISVPENAETTVSATAYDTSGNVSPCSDPFGYTEDSIAPATPTLSATDPPSPANNHLPKFLGTAESGSTVRFYASSDCTGPAAATRPASDLNGAGAEIEVPENETTTVRVTATDAAGNVSGCSSPISYVEDSASATPSLAAFDPSSPANQNFPKLRGSGAEADSTITVYSGPDCAGPPLFVFPNGAAAFNGAGVEIEVQDNTTDPYRVNATDPVGNVSGCSNALSYTEDSLAPAAPTLTATDPGSAANQNSPKVRGAAEAGAQVRLFASTDCSGAPIGTGTSGELGGAGVTASVPDNATTQFRATATDAAGNASECSAPVSYAEDSSAPDTTATTPKKKVKTKRKTVKVRFAIASPEPGASFECRVDGASFAACAASVTVKLKKGKHTFEAAAIDSAGNRDASSATVKVKVVRKRT
jgi:subtilisin-like proprotein convertase family protein